MSEHAHTTHSGDQVQSEAPKPRSGTAAKVWIFALSLIFLLIMFGMEKCSGAKEGTKKNKKSENASSFPAEPTDDNPLFVDLTGEFSKIIYYTKNADWIWVIGHRVEIELSTDPANPKKTWNPEKENRNIYYGETLYGRTIHGEEITAKFWYEKIK